MTERPKIIHEDSQYRFTRGRHTKSGAIEERRTDCLGEKFWYLTAHIGEDTIAFHLLSALEQANEENARLKAELRSQDTNTDIPF